MLASSISYSVSSKASQKDRKILLNSSLYMMMRTRSEIGPSSSKPGKNEKYLSDFANSLLIDE